MTLTNKKTNFLAILFLHNGHGYCSQAILRWDFKEHKSCSILEYLWIRLILIAPCLKLSQFSSFWRKPDPKNQKTQFIRTEDIPSQIVTWRLDTSPLPPCSGAGCGGPSPQAGSAPAPVKEKITLWSINAKTFRKSGNKTRFFRCSPIFRWICNIVRLQFQNNLKDLTILPASSFCTR